MMITVEQFVREIAGDYLHLAADADGKVDMLRKQNYRKLLKVADGLSGTLAGESAAPR
jgi:hypothetical protein